MKSVYDAKYCSLHVRVTNRAAMALYRDVLGYEICSTADEYYADKEDAYDMKMFFDPSVRPQILKSAKASAKFGEEEKTGEDALGGNAMADDTQPDQTTNEESKSAATTAAQSEASQSEAAAGEKKKKKKNKKKKKKADVGEENQPEEEAQPKAA